MPAEKRLLTLIPGALSLPDLRAIWQGEVRLALTAEAWPAVEASHAAVAAIVARGEPAYGINTGFGKLAGTHIAHAQLATLQNNLIRSHAVGVGEPLEARVVRLVLACKIASLARGVSGVRRCVLETLLALYNAGIVPLIPCQGSVGASGDLAPLAHLTMTLMGEGRVRVDSQEMAAQAALTAAGIAPLALGAKEGLALINGTQVSTALALQGLFLGERVFAAGIASGALSVDAAKGSDAPFDARIHAVRGQPGQISVAAHYRTLLAGSQIRASHLANDTRVQDPYSLRCQPQVMGACLDILRQSAATLAIEANAVSDNPLIFADEERHAAPAGAARETFGGTAPCAEKPDNERNNTRWSVLSGGNFHAEPVAFAADTLALAIAEIGALAERRIALLIDTTLSGLPPFLVPNAGLNSGFMIAHVTAAALASENKSLAHPASVDSLPTSANQEDHVSMATFAARRLTAMAHNSACIVGIELLCAAQGIDFHRPLHSSKALEAVHARLRREVTFYAEDRYLAPDIAAAQALVLGGELDFAARHLLPSIDDGAAP